MTFPIHIRLSLAVAALGLILAGLPQRTAAQRFGHPAPAFHPAPAPAFRPAPPPPRPVPGRQDRWRSAPENRSVPENRSINGGNRNFGAHDFNRPNGNPRPAPVVDVHARVTTPPRERVNIYHTGGYRGVHPYYYHPYRPTYWGPRWHPIGFFLNSLAADAFYFSLGGQGYYYDDGAYYQPSNGGYSVVPPPIGAVVSSLPDGYETTMVGNDTYYYYGGAFYIDNGQGYQVVAAPPGAVVTEIPVGAVQQQDDQGQTYLVYNNVYYQPISQDGQDAYEVIQMGN